MVKAMFRTCIAVVALIAVGMSASVATAVPFSWAIVGDAGNAADSKNGYGAVSYVYGISETEVTVSQYAEFLNAKAASDPFDLYSATMATEHGGLITRAGTDGSYTYDVVAGQGNLPVVNVLLPDAQRFVNWLRNGQGAGDTEAGVYDMSLVSFHPTAPPNGTVPLRDGGASSYVLASRDEWYKAAYYQPFADGGDVDDYWDYANGSNVSPTVAEAVYGLGFGSPADVGSTGVTSYYGTLDQNGNVWEMTDTLTNPNPIARHSVLGNSYFDAALGTPAEIKPNPLIGNPPNVGFRVANLAIPEPSSIVLFTIAVSVFLCPRKK